MVIDRQLTCPPLPIPVFAISEGSTFLPLTQPAERMAGGRTECRLEDLFVEGEARAKAVAAVDQGKPCSIHGLSPKTDATRVYSGMLEPGSGLLCLMEETEAENRRQDIFSQYAALKTEISILKRELSETDGLIRNVAHDLRSPLATALSFAELTLEMFGDELHHDSKEFIGHVCTAINIAFGIVEDLLKYSQLDAPAGRHVSLHSIGEELARDFSVQAADGTLELDWQVETVWADPVTLYRILSNLQSNAIKYRRPTVPLVLRIRSRAVGQRVRIEAEDNGRGIPKDDRDRVFARLERVDSVNRGHGIGLATVHKLVRRSGGEMGLTDGIDGGTMVWVELPLKKLEGSRDTTGLMTGAIMAHAKGDIETAIRRIEEAMSMGNDNPGHWAIAASIYRSAGKIKETENALREAIRLHPRRAEYHIDLAIHHAKQGATSKARELFQNALRLDDRDPYVLENYGTYLALIEKKPEEAAVLWRRALARGSRRTSLLLNLAEKGLVDGALADAEQYLSMIRLGEEPFQRRARAQALWLLLDLMSDRSPKVDSLARFISLVPSADLPSQSADHRELRLVVMANLHGEAHKLAVTILDVLDGKESPKILQPFLPQLSHGERVGD